MRSWEKTVPGHLLDCSWYEGVETRESENKFRLGVEGCLRGQWPAWPLCRQRVVGWGIGDCLVCIRICAGLEPADGDNLVPGPDWGSGSAAQDRVGDIVGPLQGLNDAAVVHLDEGGMEVPREFLWQLAARVVLAS